MTTIHTRYFNDEDTFRGKGFIEVGRHRPIFGKYVYSGKSGFFNVRVLENDIFENEDHPLNKKFRNNRGCVILDANMLKNGVVIYDTYPTFPDLTRKSVLRIKD